MTEIKEITVAELNELYHSGDYDIEISTPDGFQRVTDWFDKGVLPITKVVAENGLVTVCANNHLLQTSDSESNWIPASEVIAGETSLLTELGMSKAVTVVSDYPRQCFDFTVDHPNHRYWGDGFSSHNSGKSYICSGNIVRNAQKQGMFVVLIDSENALDQAWLEALGVDTSEDKLLKLNMAMIDDVAKTIYEFMKEYKAMPEEDRPKVLFVVDSLGMLLTPTDVNQFESGDLKGDMGRKPKALTALVRNCVNMFGSYNVGMVVTNHTYASMDPYSVDPNISGGCLTAGHKIWMSDGSTKNIEDIQVGDVVVTLEGDIDVSETFTFNDKEVFEIELEDGEIIQATGEHKFLTRNDDNQLVWKTVTELDEDDEILKVV